MSPLFPPPLRSHCHYSDMTFKPSDTECLCPDIGSLVMSALRSQRPSSFVLLHCCQLWCVRVQGWGGDPQVALRTQNPSPAKLRFPRCRGAAPAPCPLAARLCARHFCPASYLLSRTLFPSSCSHLRASLPPMLTYFVGFACHWHFSKGGKQDSHVVCSSSNER